MSSHTLEWQQNYVAEIDLSPSPSPSLFRSLGDIVRRGETVMLGDGRVLSKVQLYVEALRCGTPDGTHHICIAKALEPGETVALPDGRVMDKRQLCVEAVRCSAGAAWACYELGNVLGSCGDTVTLADGRVMDKRQLYVEALRRAPFSDSAAQGLAELLDADERIRLADGRITTRKELHIQAIRYNMYWSEPFNGLGKLLAPDEVARLHDGRVMNRRELFCEAIRVRADACDAYNNLGLTLSEGEMAALPNDAIADRRQLHIMAILSCRPTGADAEVLENSLVWLGLAMKQPGETVTYGDCWAHGAYSVLRTVTRRQAFVRSVRESKASSNRGLVALALSLDAGEKIAIAEGQAAVDAKQLLIEAFAPSRDFDTKWPRRRRSQEDGGEENEGSNGFNGFSLHKAQAPLCDDDSDEMAGLEAAIQANDLRAFTLRALRRRLAAGESVTLPDGTVCESGQQNE